MIQKIFVLILFTAIFSFLSCNNNEKKEGLSSTLSQENTIYNVAEFPSISDSLENDTVFVKGIIEHLCRHSAQRFKIIDINGNGELKVETNGNVERPSASNIGKIIIVKGKPVPTNLNMEDLDKMEQSIRSTHKGEEETSNFKNEIKNVQNIKDQLISGQIPYYTVYHLEAFSYEFQK